MKDIRKHLNIGSPARETMQFGPDDFFERYIFMEKKNGICRIREILDAEEKRLYPEVIDDD